MMFAVTFLGAVVSAIARGAGNGTPLAKAALIVIGFLIACLVCFTLFFLFCWAFATITAGNVSRPSQQISPDSSKLPPRIFPPRDAKP